MKINRRNPKHWWYLIVSGALVVLAVIIRPLLRVRRAKSPTRVLLYGHKLGGNLLAIYRYIRAHSELGIEVTYLTLDPHYGKDLQNRGESCTWLTSPRCLRRLILADALISDHGLHSLIPLLYASDLRFIDVWHGIPFKGFDADDFRTQHRYDEVWVASPLIRQLYVDRFGFRPERVVVTGYSRTDLLVTGTQAQDQLRRRMCLPASGRLVVFAPTWKQDDAGRSIYPFDMEEAEFLSQMDSTLAKLDARLVLRTHLNSGLHAKLQGSRVLSMPYADEPDTEALLLVSDLLICDWSSIAFDFLVLDRPAIFIDVPAPFHKGFSLGPEFRFGTVVSDIESLCSALEHDLGLRRGRDEFRQLRARIKEQVYEGFADGNASRRGVDRLTRLKS